MRKCWEMKGKNRPTFAALVPVLHTALDKQCPDKSLIKRPQSSQNVQLRENVQHRAMVMLINIEFS